MATPSPGEVRVRVVLRVRVVGCGAGVVSAMACARRLSTAAPWLTPG